MNDKKYSIIIVDDHKIVSATLKRIFSEIPEVATSTSASTGNEALYMADNIRFDLCVVDLELPDMSGLELIEKIRKKHHGIKIIVCTMHEEIWIVSEVVRANVDGMITKTAEIEEYRNAVTNVLHGGTYFCDRFVEVRRKTSVNNDPLLTECELRVLKMLIKGLSTKQIAEKLFRSANTVDSHRRHIMEKMQVSNVVELINKAHKMGYTFE